MGRCVSAPALVRCTKTAASNNKNIIVSRNFWHRRPPTYLPSPFVHEFDKAMSQMQHEFDRVINSSFWRPFVDNQHPSVIETYRLRNPIVEDNGVKKFKLEFDVRRFKPEDVKISTDSQKNTLTVEAKYSDENSKFEYQRTISVPDGVKPADITCTYKSDGVLLLEAPYIEPEKPEAVKDTVINIEHK
jgi:HSP20 family molecular chaperone IbpA